jgi:peptidoglycan hydrolase CwlO-like protein
MSDSDSTILSKWTELKALVEALEVDVAKNAKGVAAAGVRTRKGLRQLQSSAKELVKLTLETDKANKGSKE